MQFLSKSFLIPKALLTLSKLHKPTFNILTTLTAANVMSSKQKCIVKVTDELLPFTPNCLWDNAGLQSFDSISY